MPFYKICFANPQQGSIWPRDFSSCIPNSWGNHVAVWIDAIANVWFSTWMGTSKTIFLSFQIHSVFLFPHSTDGPLPLLYGSISHTYLPGASHEEGALFLFRVNPFFLLPFHCFPLNWSINNIHLLIYCPIIYFLKKSSWHLPHRP